MKFTESVNGRDTTSDESDQESIDSNYTNHNLEDSNEEDVNIISGIWMLWMMLWKFQVKMVRKKNLRIIHTERILFRTRRMSPMIEIYQVMKGEFFCILKFCILIIFDF